MKAIIMAGGEGTRLRPLTCSMPKPLSPLCGKPVVHYILDLLSEHGFDEAVFTLGYKAQMIEDLFETGRYKDILLHFSREDVPLGTAGCVKKAVETVGGFNDDFLVISGDALCDFELSKAMSYHKSKGARATIITKCVDDPREYGLVISNNDGENSGEIISFSEKPSYLSCTTDCANTGVYVLSPEVIELIPNNAQYDFARDVFPKMLGNKGELYSYNEKGYWCDIGDFSSYSKSQRDILLGKVRCKKEGREIEKGVFSKTLIPNNVILTPPCYIGENVTFSSGNAIRITGSVIGDNVGIGSSVKLRGSTVLDNAFISDGVTVNEAIVCKGAKILHSAGVYERSVIGENCTIGREATISNAKIWNNKIIPPGANVTSDVKYSVPNLYSSDFNGGLSDRGITGETNAEITPELCSRIGAALGCISSSRNRIAISSEDNNASLSMKLGIISGASGSGGEVFDIGTASLPQLIYASRLLGCGIVVRVKAGVFSSIEILGRQGLPLTRLEERRLEAAIFRSEYKRASFNSFGEIKTIEGFDEIYLPFLYRHSNFKSDYRIRLSCDNKRICEKIIPVFDKISSDTANETLVVAITDGGSKCEFYTEDDIKIGYEQLILLAITRLMKKGRDVALPNDFAASADLLAKNYGKKVHRFFLCPNDSSDEYARELSLNQSFLRDGVILSLNVLSYLAENSLTIKDCINTIPRFATEQREIEINCPPQRIISGLCSCGEGICGRGEGILISEGDKRENVLVRAGKRGQSLFLIAESLSAEVASKLCDDTETLIKLLDDKLKG